MEYNYDALRLIIDLYCIFANTLPQILGLHALLKLSNHPVLSHQI